VNLASTLHQAAQREPDVAALIVHDVCTATYKQWSETVRRLARGLVEHYGLRRGDRVCLAMSNRPEYLTVLYACWHAGLCAVPTNVKLHPRELGYIAAKSGARLCVVDAGVISAWQANDAAPPSSPALLDVGGAQFDQLCVGPPIDLCEVAANEPAWIFFTSGTTGRPKGAVLTHRNLLAMSLSYYADYGSVEAADRIVHAAPMSHGSGLYALPFTMKAAAHVVPAAAAHFDPVELIETINAHRRVTMFLAPTMIVRLLDCPRLGRLAVERITQILYGGGPMHLEDLRRALQFFGPRMAQLYGQGESPMTISALTREQHFSEGRLAAAEVLASAGVPRTGVEVRIVGSDGKQAAAGQIGEIAVRGDVVMVGYWDDPEATAHAMQDGWLLTGDLGSFGPDGRLTLKGRSKELIISGGSNIYPREVEEVLLEHPALAEVAVIGVADVQWGEIVVACVACHRDMQVGGEDLHAFCLERIARFKRPKRYVFLHELPKNAAGKIDKLSLKQGLLDQNAALNIMRQRLDGLSNSEGLSTKR
jgi:long-chain acyl-CoA synthetase